MWSHYGNRKKEEAGIEGIPAIGFSLDTFDYDADFRAAEVQIKQIIKQEDLKKMIW